MHPDIIKMKEINFISSGMMGDFIHNLSTIKNICERENAKANVYLTDNISKYGYDHWRYGAFKAYTDLHDLVIAQEYINEFGIENGPIQEEYINLNNFRIGLTPPFKTWTELLSSTFGYEIPKEYKWINLDVEKTNKVVIHSSTRRENPSFDWDLLNRRLEGFEKVFVTCSETEFINFPLSRYGQIKLKLVITMSEMAHEIASAKYFIGNQSAPFALASALDVPRLVILDAEPAPFYMGEQEFSKNISWYLDDSVKYRAENCIVNI